MTLKHIDSIHWTGYTDRFPWSVLCGMNWVLVTYADHVLVCDGLQKHWYNLQGSLFGVVGIPVLKEMHAISMATEAQIQLKVYVTVKKEWQRHMNMLQAE